MIKVHNTPTLVTERLLLRKFTLGDADDLFLLYSDKTVNTFLPWFPHTSKAETEHYIKTVVLPEYDKPCSYFYLVELAKISKAVGYVTLKNIDSYDLGYGLAKEYWRQGIISEACRAVVAQAKKDGFPYLTATHDINNPASGAVMKKIGMQYCYSYVEQVQPKNTVVTFRMYQLNFAKTCETYMGYWNKYGTGFIES